MKTQEKSIVNLDKNVMEHILMFNIQEEKTKQYITGGIIVLACICFSLLILVNQWFILPAGVSYLLLGWYIKRLIIFINELIGTINLLYKFLL